MRVLVFGDSITQGYWDTDGGWVNHVRKHYDSKQLTDLEGLDEPTVFNLGVSADNSKNILDRIVPETIARTRHGNLPIIIIQIGVNDSSTDNLSADKGVSLSIVEYEQNLKLIIENVKPISSGIILAGLSACDEALTTPVFWGDFHYTNKAIKDYENSMALVAEKYGIAFIPVFDKFKKELDEGRKLLPDGLHPNNEGHLVMYEIIAKDLFPLLEL